MGPPGGGHQADPPGVGSPRWEVALGWDWCAGASGRGPVALDLAAGEGPLELGGPPHELPGSRIGLEVEAWRGRSEAAGSPGAWLSATLRSGRPGEQDQGSLEDGRRAGDTGGEGRGGAKWLGSGRGGARR